MKKDNLNKAFRELRKLGYFARQNFMCCQSCAWAAVPEGKEEKVVFYHAQDADKLKNNNRVYLAWSGNGHEICKVLENNNLPYDWADESEDSRILITKVS